MFCMDRDPFLKMPWQAALGCTVWQPWFYLRLPDGAGTMA